MPTVRWVFQLLTYKYDTDKYIFTVKAVRVPDEGKLPVSWLAGNQGEYATSTEVTMRRSTK